MVLFRISQGEKRSRPGLGIQKCQHVIAQYRDEHSKDIEKWLKNKYGGEQEHVRKIHQEGKSDQKGQFC